MLCPAWVAIPQTVREGEGSGSAVLGTAIHKFIELVGRGLSTRNALEHISKEFHDECNLVDIDALGLERGDRFEVSVLYDSYNQSALIGDDAKKAEIDPSRHVSGSLDHLRYKDGELTVTDWKTGNPSFVPRAEFNRQLKGYTMAAFLALEALGFRVKKSTGRIGFVRNGDVSFDSAEYSLETLKELQKEIDITLRKGTVAKLQVARGQRPDLNPGSHCKFCPGFEACPAQDSMMKKMLRGGLMLSESKMTPEGVGSVWTNVKNMQLALKKVEAQVAYWVRENGPVPLPSGRSLCVISRGGNRSLDPQVAAEVILETLNPEYIKETTGKDVTKEEILKDVAQFKVTQASIQRAVRNLNLPGKLKDTIMAEIEKRGGVTRAKPSDTVGEK